MDGKSIFKGCLGLTTFSSAGFSLALAFVGFSNILEGGPDLGASIGVFVFVTMLFGFFSFATYKIFAKKKIVSDPQILERKALEFAHLKKGYVSVAGFALHEKISIDDAGVILDELVVKNVARAEVSSSGKLVYLFDAFIDADVTRKDTLEIAIENAKAATANLKKERAVEEAKVEEQVEVDAYVDY